MAMIATKPVYLTQHLRYGDSRTGTESLNLSLNDEERNYYICRQQHSTEIKEDFELLAVKGKDLSCLAVIHTQNGFACLEALVPEVRLSCLGKRFDGNSAHDFPVKPTVPGEPRAFIQIRPGENFYVKDLSFTLVPEEYNDSYVEMESSGPPESRYERYSQLVSQKEGDSQSRETLATPSPEKTKMPATVLETPMRQKPSLCPSPLIHGITAAAMTGKEDSQEWPTVPEKRGVMYELREAIGNEESNRYDQVENPLPERPPENDFQCPGKESILDMDNEDLPSSDAPHQPEEADNQCASPAASRQMTEHSPQPPDGIPRTSSLESSRIPIASANFQAFQEAGLGTSVLPANSQSVAECNNCETGTEEDGLPQRKKRKLSPPPSPAVAEESEDSLEDSTIEVALKAPTPNAAVTPGAPSAEDSEDSLEEEPIEVAPKQFASGAALKSGTPSRITSTMTSSTPSTHAESIKTQTPSTATSVQESPAPTTEPTSSMRSTRSPRLGSHRCLDIDNDGFRVLFASSTTVGDSRVFKKFLSEQDVKVVNRLEDATCLCVGNEELKRTSKVVWAVLRGIDIIRESWVIDSAQQKELQPIESHLARDPPREDVWGIKLDEAIERGRQGVRVFHDWAIIITPSAKKDLGKTNFSDLKDILDYAGAKKVVNTLPKKGPDELPATLVIGTQEDSKSPALKKWKCYSKDLISLSVLRGRLDVESDEFLISWGPKPQEGNKKRKR